ncbi:hypothetical protein [Vreelandella sp. H-I2]
MKHVDKCDKCGKEYNPDTIEASDEVPKCGTCGAEIYEQGSPSAQAVDDEKGQHLLEKGLRKMTKGITGHKR